jgi:hypothetical protein
VAYAARDQGKEDGNMTEYVSVPERLWIVLRSLLMVLLWLLKMTLVVVVAVVGFFIKLILGLIAIAFVRSLHI